MKIDLNDIVMIVTLKMQLKIIQGEKLKKIVI